MRLRLPVLIAIALTSVVVAAASPASSATSAPSAQLKSCSAGFVHAKLSWGEKCLHAGEFCKVGNLEYRVYGFSCPASGHLVSSSAIGASKTTTRPVATTPSPTSTSMTTTTTATTTTRSTTTTAAPTPAPPPTTTTQAPAPPPATTATPAPVPPPATTTTAATTGPTALCKDGTLSYSATHSGTCSSHGGVAVWYR
jgi:hypothetical protein